MRIASLALLVVCALSFHDSARADWIQNGIPLTNVTGSGADCAPDGAGGAIVCWIDNRFGTYDVFAQRVDGFGNTLWAVSGVLVCGAVGDQTSPSLIADGAGGAIVVWTDNRTGEADVYVQRLNSAGSAQWTVNGVALCTATNTQILSSMLSDGAGGAIVAWQDARSGSHWDVYARRINAAGTPQWTANGNPICTLLGHQTRPAIVTDGAGGAIICWTDARIATLDIFAQRVNSAGTTQWTANGLVVCGAPNNQAGNAAVSDGAGGAIIVWEDERSSPDEDIYAQRINGAGAAQWLVDGLSMVAAPGRQSNLVLTSDGAGGAIAAWQDERVNPNVEVDLYAQRMNLNGIAVWEYNGVPVCAGPGVTSSMDLATDGQNGAIFTWTDNRLPSDDDIFAQRVSGDGVPRWLQNGVYVGAALGSQGVASCAPDNTGGIIAAWSDARSGSSVIYAQRIEPRYGYWGRPEPTAISVSDNPNDQGGVVNVRWDASQLDLFFAPGITSYSIWRSTDFVAEQAGTNVRIVNDPVEALGQHEGVIIWKEVTPSTAAFWEWVGSVPAQFLDTYSFSAPTRQDGSTHYFKVIALESPVPPSRAWESGLVSGSSLDNLAPPPPIQLSGSSTPWDITLTWQSGGPIPDFSQYVIYRGSGFVLPLPQYRIGVDTQTHHVDDSVPNGNLRYIVTAMDTHGNESAPSNEWSPGGLTPVDGTPSITKLTVLGNVPNPFNHTTTLRVGLPKASDLHIELFDVAGRRVRDEHTPQLGAGWRQISIVGRDAGGTTLASGVYFCRVTAAGQSVTRKMIVAR